MELRRWWRHWTFPHARVRKLFPRRVLQAIEDAIRVSERHHLGELRFVVEGGLDWPLLWRGVSARERALELFSQLRVWDTEHNSGVLIYLQLADRRVEIIADRGIHKKVGADTWRRLCADMERAFRAGRFEEGALQGVQAIGRLLAEHFPAPADNPDELPDAPLVL